MHQLLDFFSLNDWLPLILLICLLYFVGRQVAGDSAADRWWARGFGIAGFLFYVGAGIARWGVRTPTGIFQICVQATFAMATVFGAALVTVPIVRFLHEQLWTRPRALTATDSRKREQAVIEQRRREKEDERRREPDRERERKEYEKQAKERAFEQKRREDCRASAEIKFQLHQHVLAARFDKAAFDNWVKQYMNDQFPASYVEERAKQISELIDVFLQKIEPVSTGPSTEVIAARSDLEAFYQENPEVHALCPPRRFQAEIRVRIPDNASKETAWKEARDMMKELLDLVAQDQTARHQAASKAAKPVNPPLNKI